jgi:hypothetical protein
VVLKMQWLNCIKNCWLSGFEDAVAQSLWRFGGSVVFEM